MKTLKKLIVALVIATGAVSSSKAGIGISELITNNPMLAKGAVTLTGGLAGMLLADKFFPSQESIERGLNKSDKNRPFWAKLFPDYNRGGQSAGAAHNVVRAGIALSALAGAALAYAATKYFV